MRAKLLTTREDYRLLATAGSLPVMTTNQTAKAVPVRIPPEMVARIDQLRGLVPRETYIRVALLEPAIEAAEKKEKKR